MAGLVAIAPSGEQRSTDVTHSGILRIQARFYVRFILAFMYDPLPRSNEVSVDGVDALDNSVNGIRATVSQEAVQEFQIIQSNYMPKFGRATGGVVNIVTKSGSNETHGNLFGFLRDKSL
jgi:hypothetical protein